MPNRLALSASPYLRSHADNPVDWWPWGEEAFAEAVKRDVPVLVSIGYSTCHWCHVMARESFSDPEVAAIMNENLVAIKVDREEHAEVDTTYLAAASVFTQNLGWPLNVFVTPQGRAFFAGTYWPPQPAAGHPSFRQVLGGVLEAWTERREEVERNGEAILGALAHGNPTNDTVEVDFDAVVASLAAVEDPEFGGFGAAPKFPATPVLGLLADRASVGDAPARALLERTLDAMAASPLRDLDGGFFRYSTQRNWSEPHYERMLYDNAQLLAVYALAGRDEVATGIADFLLTTLQLPSGGFASAQDSESVVDGKRVEGFYYSLDAGSRARLEPPALDGKVLTGWNGLAIEALALAGTLLEREDWVAAAERAADFVLSVRDSDGRIVRASIEGTVSTARPTLEDYGMLATGLTHLATATGDVRWADEARQLVDDALAAGDPFGVPGGADPVLSAQGIVVSADESDGAYPSGLASLATAAHRLYLLTSREPYSTAAAGVVARASQNAVRQPIAFGSTLSVASALSEPVRQLVVVTSDDTDAAAAAARSYYRSGGISLVLTGDQAAAWAARGFELLEGRVTTAGVTTSYVCEDFTCRLPVTDPEELLRLL
ncbi:thioredoxin domain-containing protein [soil metagenome]